MLPINRDKVFTVLVASTLISQLAWFASNNAWAVYFSDIQNHWARNAIQELGDKNILGGYPDGSFKPYAPVTRAEFSAMLAKSLNMNTNTSASAGFRDVPYSHWASGPIATVRSQGLISGYPGNLFMPSKNISRAEAMSILGNALNMTSPSTEETHNILSRFYDANQVPGWARQAVGASIKAGIAENSPDRSNYLDPMQAATRGEIAAMLENIQAHENLAYTPSSENFTQIQNTTNQSQTLKGHIVTVPAQTKFVATLNTALNSETNREGDRLVMTVNQPLVSTSGQVAVPVGSQVYGYIQMIEESGRLKRDARMDLAFTEIVTPQGQRIPISGSVDAEDGILRADSTKGRVLKTLGNTAVGAGIGAALGTAMGPLSGGSVGKGAIYGTAIGAGVGAAKAAIDKGKELELSAGEQLELRLDQAVNISL